MSKEIGEKEDSFYVKCTITEELDEALKILKEKIDITTASVVRAALHEHIIKHYPDYLPMSKREIINEVKKKFYFEKYNEEFREQEYLKNRILYIAGHIEGTKNDIIANETKFNKVVEKIKKVDPKNKSDLEELQSQKNHLQKNLKKLKTVLEDQKSDLEDQKKRIIDRTL